jgi:hypothetical protein
VYRSIRDLHRYVGLFLSPFVVLYAASAVLLNHAYLPWGGQDARPKAFQSVRVLVRDSEDGLAVAGQVRAQLGIHGEIGYVSREKQSARLNFPIETPGTVTQVRVDLATGTATVERKDTGVWDAAIYLHKTPGPHNVKLRGNWVFMQLWRWVADASVYLLLFLTATGIYLWTVIKAQRRMGRLCVGAGAVAFVALVAGIVG